jgi:hypothetical protein
MPRLARPVFAQPGGDRSECRERWAKAVVFGSVETRVGAASAAIPLFRPYRGFSGSIAAEAAPTHGLMAGLAPAAKPGALSGAV